LLISIASDLIPGTYCRRRARDETSQSISKAEEVLEVAVRSNSEIEADREMVMALTFPPNVESPQLIAASALEPGE
jgi:hypothetical protein